jgi:hypothetical protein
MLHLRHKYCLMQDEYYCFACTRVVVGESSTRCSHLPPLSAATNTGTTPGRNGSRNSICMNRPRPCPQNQTMKEPWWSVTGLSEKRCRQTGIDTRTRTILLRELLYCFAILNARIKWPVMSGKAHPRLALAIGQASVRTVCGIEPLYIYMHL